VRKVDEVAFITKLKHQDRVLTLHERLEQARAPL
jgi:hypothetical protein